jgi:DNA adenine methylase
MSNATLRPPVKWHGGKFYLAKKIIALFPKHSTYVEPFGGAASVLLNKPPVGAEIYNDIDQRIVNFFEVLRDHQEELRRLLSLTPYSEFEFTEALKPTDNKIEQARRNFVLWRQSIGGRGTSFSETLHRTRRGMADVVSGYLSAIDDELPKIAERFRRVQILNRDAIDVIKKWDSPHTLFYLDPPYVHSTRTSTSVYAHEMTDADHRRLAEVLSACNGKVVLSGYPSDLYEELYAGWRKVSFEVANNAAGGKQKARMEEMLWLNFDPEEVVPVTSGDEVDQDFELVASCDDR